MRHTYAAEHAARTAALDSAIAGIDTPAMPGREADKLHFAALALSFAVESLLALEAKRAQWERYQDAWEAHVAAAFDLSGDLFNGGAFEPPCASV
jgi:hypothetical protein